jgi:hypothetical protein
VPPTSAKRKPRDAHVAFMVFCSKFRSVVGYDTFSVSQQQSFSLTKTPAKTFDRVIFVEIVVITQAILAISR